MKLKPHNRVKIDKNTIYHILSDANNGGYDDLWVDGDTELPHRMQSQLLTAAPALWLALAELDKEGKYADLLAYANDDADDESVVYAIIDKQ